MGHYCDTCGEKLMGGVVPTTCNCVECFCQGCWDRLFDQKNYIETKEKCYRLNTETKEFEEIPTPLYELEPSEPPVCEHCSIPFDDTKYCMYGQPVIERSDCPPSAPLSYEFRPHPYRVRLAPSIKSSATG